MLEHGGNLALAAKQYGIPLENWLDLSTGINPNGYPIPEIPQALWQRLPSENDGLIEAACTYYGATSILPTAGSQAALQLLPTLCTASKVAMLKPMYNEHAQAWLRCGHQVTTFENYPNDDLLNTTDVLLICNPNNPTAAQFSAETLLAWHAALAKRGGWLVVDEAFIDTTPEHSLAQYTHLHGLIVLRSLGKFFGLAGARVGFLLAHKTLLNQAQEAIGPWSLTGPSRYVATQALLDTQWQQATRLQLANNSQRLTELLTQYGLSPLAGTALFQFVPTKNASMTQQLLAKQGVWVRLFSEASSLRFGLPPENSWQHLESALMDIQHAL
jgi:cobalamin biosynthesis protein CobC